MKPQALVLDFGGVISRMLFETHPLTEAALGLAPGTLRWRGPFDPAHDPLWRAMQAVIRPEAVAATHTGTLKPDPRACQACAAELGLPAGA